MNDILFRRSERQKNRRLATLLAGIIVLYVGAVIAFIIVY